MRNGLVFILLVSVGCLFSPRVSAGVFPVSSTAEQIRLELELRAQQFLNRATFGATDADIKTLADRMARVGVNRACTEWIDQQMAMPATLHVPTIQRFLTEDNLTVTSQTGVQRFRHHAWWHNAITAPDQLKQRLAWALIQICVVSESINDTNFVPDTLDTNQPPYWFGLSSYYDMLLQNCDKSYRNVLHGVTYHPMMGLMLSSLRNPKGDPVLGTFPDENYAREIMQLFSIGLYELNDDGTFKKDAQQNSIPTYDNSVIQEFARAFTGLNYAMGNGTSINSGNRDFVNTMIMTGSVHDTGSKHLLNGKTVPGNADGHAGISTALDNIYAHPNVAPFISRLLIQRFVMSNPSKEYISRVAKVFNNNGVGVRGDMKAVMKAILVDRHAWASIQITRLSNPLRLEVSGAGTEYCRLFEPVVQYASFFRRYGRNQTVNNGRFYLPATPGTWNQSPFRSPSVFNFYLPNFQPSGGISTATPSDGIPNGELFAPEFQLMTSVVANAWQNRTRDDIRNGYYEANNSGVRTRFNFDFSKELALAGNPTELVTYLDRVMCNGTMTEDFKSRLVAAIVAVIPTTSNNLERVRGAMITTANSPFYLVRH